MVYISKIVLKIIARYYLKIGDNSKRLNSRNRFEPKEDSKNEFNRNTISLVLRNTEKGRSIKEAKLKPKTIWREILDLIYFCYEFVMVMAVIASAIILPSIVT